MVLSHRHWLYSLGKCSLPIGLKNICEQHTYGEVEQSSITNSFNTWKAFDNNNESKVCKYAFVTDD